MNAKERFYSGLAKETIGKITSNTDNWTSFLRTMSLTSLPTASLRSMMNRIKDTSLRSWRRTRQRLDSYGTDSQSVVR